MYNPNGNNNPSLFFLKDIIERNDIVIKGAWGIPNKMHDDTAKTTVVRQHAILQLHNFN